MQKNTIVFNCLEHDLASYSMIVFIGKCKIISKYFPALIPIIALFIISSRQIVPKLFVR